MPSFRDCLHMYGRCTRLLASDELGFDPYGLNTSSQIGRMSPTVVHCAGTDDQDGSTGEGGFPAFDFIHGQDRGGHVTSVSTPFTNLSADELDADFESIGGGGGA